MRTKSSAHPNREGAAFVCPDLLNQQLNNHHNHEPWKLRLKKEEDNYFDTNIPPKVIHKQNLEPSSNSTFDVRSL